MSFDPLFESGIVVTAHAFAALLALGLGASQLFFSQGGSRHRGLGYVWVTLMGGVAISSFWIHDIRQIGPFSLIHVLSVVTLHSLYLAIRAVRRGDVIEHAKIMRSLFYLALIGAGSFTLLPGRDMHLVVFGQ